MIHGDVVMMTSEGILVHDKALQPLGIFDQSLCWAVWAASPYEELEVGGGVFKKGYPNLVISPIHPSSWPYLIRLEVNLRDKEGALAWLCGMLNDSGMSILFIECSTAGFSHAFCSIIAENISGDLNKFRERKEQVDLKHPYVRTSPNHFAEAQETANEIAARMFIKAQEIEDALNKSGTDEDKYLHSWKKEGEKQRFLFHMAKVKKIIQAQPSVNHGKCISYIHGHLPKTATAHYMQRLAHFSIYGGGLDVPFALRYNANSALLKLTRNEVFPPEGISIYPKEDAEKGTKKDRLFELGPLPKPAICIYDSQDKYLRLKPVTSEILKNELTRISVEYRVVKPPNESAALGSVGLLHLIGSKLQTLGVNMFHITNKSTRYEYAIKAGIISCIADVAAGNYSAVKAAIMSINLDKPPKLEDLSIEAADVHPYPQQRLFVSLHFGHPRQGDIEKIIKKVAHERGFEDTIVETYVAPATQTILDKIGSCQAFLQLLLLRGEEDPKQLSFSWLDFEYGVANGKGMPTVRLVDTVRVSSDWWKSHITTNPDQRVREFRSDACDEELTNVIRKAIEELAQELLRRKHEIG